METMPLCIRGITVSFSSVLWKTQFVVLLKAVMSSGRVQPNPLMSSKGFANPSIFGAATTNTQEKFWFITFLWSSDGNVVRNNEKISKFAHKSLTLKCLFEKKQIIPENYEFSLGVWKFSEPVNFQSFRHHWKLRVQTIKLKTSRFNDWIIYPINLDPCTVTVGALRLG